MQRTGEQRLADARGKFCWARRGGRDVNDADWTPGRVLLSNRRLVLVGSGGKLTVSLSKVTNVGGRFDVNQRVAGEAQYVAIHIEEDVLLVVAHDEDEFETAFYGALVGRDTLRTRHPAIVGGVVQDTDWQDARVKVEPEAVAMATTKGSFVEIPYEEVGAVRSAERTVEGASVRVLEVEHADEEGTSVETYFTGKARQVAILATVFGRSDSHGVDVDLDETEQQVVMALYSGVSPFDIPEFLGIDPDRTEELFERLVELDVVEEVRVRREVALNARGRHIAGDAIENQ